MILIDIEPSAHPNKVDCLFSIKEVDALIRYGKIFSFEGIGVLVRTVKQVRSKGYDEPFYMPLSPEYLADTAVRIRDSPPPVNAAPRHSPGLIEYGSGADDTQLAHGMAHIISNFLCVRELDFTTEALVK